MAVDDYYLTLGVLIYRSIKLKTYQFYLESLAVWTLSPFLLTKPIIFRLPRSKLPSDEGFFVWKWARDITLLIKSDSEPFSGEICR